jgi:lathosterol oxidase
MRLADFFTPWATILIIDSLRYFIPVSLAYGFFWFWKREYFSGHLIQGKWAPAGQIWRELKSSLVMITVSSLVGLGIFHFAKLGIFHIYNDVSEYGWPYWIFSVLALIVLHDTYFYWTHRLMHTRWLFRRFHQVHHRSTNPSPWAAYAFSIPESVVESSFLPLALLFLPLHGLAIFVFLIHMILRNVHGHLSIEFLPSGFTRNRLSGIFNTATHHNMHHHYFNSNFGLYFTWWDRIIGTEHPDYHDHFEKVAPQLSLNKPAKQAIAIASAAAIGFFSGIATCKADERIPAQELSGTLYQIGSNHTKKLFTWKMLICDRVWTSKYLDLSGALSVDDELKWDKGDFVEYRYNRHLVNETSEVKLDGQKLHYKQDFRGKHKEDYENYHQPYLTGDGHSLRLEKLGSFSNWSIVSGPVRCTRYARFI